MTESKHTNPTEEYSTMPDIDPSAIIVNVTPSQRERLEALVTEKMPGMDLDDALKFWLLVLVDETFMEWLENDPDISDDWSPDQESQYVIQKLREW